ncbi:Nn.00g021270.m01.CDS01 [Neocucurbitaria sp. VM-36]
MARTRPPKTQSTAPAKQTSRAIDTSKVKKPKVKADPRGQTKWRIRRILAERTMAKETRYLVDWLPNWEPEVSLAGSGVILKEWERNKNKGRTFTLNGDEVLRSTNETEDVSPERVKRMLNTVAKEFKKYMTKNPAELARDLFKDNDWTFGTTKHHRNAQALALQAHDSIPTAAEVLRRTYLQMRSLRQHSFQQSDLHYGAIKVKYIGQIDASTTSSPAALLQSRPASTILNFLTPLFSTPLLTLNPSAWKNDTAHSFLHPLSCTVKTLPTHTPYLLAHPWPLFLTRLFYLSDDIAGLTKEVGIEIGEDWAEKTRDWMMWTYLERSGEADMRAVECVERTYIEARDTVRWFVGNECDGEGYVLWDSEESQSESERGGGEGEEMSDEGVYSEDAHMTDDESGDEDGGGDGGGDGDAEDDDDPDR